MKREEQPASAGTDQDKTVDSQGPEAITHPALSAATLEFAGVRLRHYAGQDDVLEFPHFDLHGTPINHRSYLLPQPDTKGERWRSSTESRQIYFPPGGVHPATTVFLVDSPVEVLICREAYDLQAIGIPELLKAESKNNSGNKFQDEVNQRAGRIFCCEQLLDNHELINQTVEISEATNLIVLAPVPLVGDISFLTKLQHLAKHFPETDLAITFLPNESIEAFAIAEGQFKSMRLTNRTLEIAEGLNG